MENVTPPSGNRVELWLEAILALLLAAIAGVLILEVAFRYFFHHSLFWVEELSRFLFLWLIFLGVGIAFRRSMHFAMRTLVDALPRPLRRVAGLIGAAAILLTALLFIFAGWELARFAQEQTSPGLGLSRFWFYLAIPLGGALTVVGLPAVIRQAWSGEITGVAHGQEPVQ